MSRQSIGRMQRCGECQGCTATMCGECVFCRDLPQFGGPGTMKQTCAARRCVRVLQGRLEKEVIGQRIRLGCGECDDCQRDDCGACLICLEKRFFNGKFVSLRALCHKKKCARIKGSEIVGGTPIDKPKRSHSKKRDRSSATKQQAPRKRGRPPSTPGGGGERRPAPKSREQEETEEEEEEDEEVSSSDVDGEDWENAYKSKSEKRKQKAKMLLKKNQLKSSSAKMTGGSVDKVARISSMSVAPPTRSGQAGAEMAKTVASTIKSLFSPSYKPNALERAFLDITKRNCPTPPTDEEELLESTVVPQTIVTVPQPPPATPQIPHQTPASPQQRRNSLLESFRSLPRATFCNETTTAALNVPSVEWPPPKVIYPVSVEPVVVSSPSLGSPTVNGVSVESGPLGYIISLDGDQLSAHFGVSVVDSIEVKTPTQKTLIINKVVR